MRRIDRLDRMVNSYLKEITKRNSQKQSKFSINYFNNLDIDKDLRKKSNLFFPCRKKITKLVIFRYLPSSRDGK